MRSNPFSTVRSRQAQNVISIQPPVLRTNSMQKRPTPTSGNYYKAQQLQGSNFREEKYFWSLKELVDQSQPTVALVLNLTTMPGQKKRFLAIQSIRTLLLDYPGSDFPNCIQLVCNTLDGYSDKGGLPTHVVGTSFPTIGATILKSGFNISNIGYQSDSGEQLWDVSGITNLTFNVVVNGSAINFPIQNPILIKAKIVRVIF